MYYSKNDSGLSMVQREHCRMVVFFQSHFYANIHWILASLHTKRCVRRYRSDDKFRIHVLLCIYVVNILKWRLYLKKWRIVFSDLLWITPCQVRLITIIIICTYKKREKICVLFKFQHKTKIIFCIILILSP